MFFENDPDLVYPAQWRGGSAASWRRSRAKRDLRDLPGTKIRRSTWNARTNFPFDSVQMPLNPFDATFDSFRKACSAGVAAAWHRGARDEADGRHGEAVKKGVVTAEEPLALCDEPAGCHHDRRHGKPEIVRHNLKIARNFQPMSAQEMQSLRDRLRTYAADARFEPYKVSLKFDNPEARLSHGFPLDMQQKEVKEMLGASENTGKPYPQYTPRQH